MAELGEHNRMQEPKQPSGEKKHPAETIAEAEKQQKHSDKPPHNKRIKHRKKHIHAAAEPPTDEGEETITNRNRQAEAEQVGKKLGEKQ